MGGSVLGCRFLGKLGEPGLDLSQPDCGGATYCAADSSLISLVNMSILASLIFVCVSTKYNKLTEAEIHVEDIWDDRKTT